MHHTTHCIVHNACRLMLVACCIRHDTSNTVRPLLDYNDAAVPLVVHIVIWDSCNGGPNTDKGSNQIFTSRHTHREYFQSELRMPRSHTAYKPRIMHRCSACSQNASCSFISIRRHIKWILSTLRRLNIITTIKWDNLFVGYI